MAAFRLATAAVAVTAAVLLAPLPATAGAPEEAVRATAEEVLEILRSDALDAAAKRAKIEDTLYRRADFDTISKLVVARNWVRFSDTQKHEFKQLFRRYLSATYGRNVDDYSNEGIEIVGGRDEPRGDYTVMSKIVRSGAEDILVDYRLRERDGRWLIIDFKAEGISMISNLRSQFQEIISKKGPDGLLDALREKAEAPEPQA